jgi:hypothetical protein
VRHISGDGVEDVRHIGAILPHSER